MCLKRADKMEQLFWNNIRLSFLKPIGKSQWYQRRNYKLSDETF